MRPTREGRVSPQRAGLVYSGIGIDPDTVTTDPEPPTDRAALGQATVPFLITGAAAAVQYGGGVAPFFNGSVSVTLTNPLTIGNVLVCITGIEGDSGPLDNLDNGPWTQFGSTVYAGNGTNWPLRAYSQTITGSTSTTTTATPSGGVGIGISRMVMIEMQGVDTLDDTDSTTNSSTTTGTLTPTSSLPAVLVSGVLSRAGSAPALTPAGGMTEFSELGTDRPLGGNYQNVASTTGSYTVGSTGAGANSAMISAAFVDTGDSVVWIDAPLTVDGDDATYDYAYDTGIEQFWRIDLGDTYLIGSMTARLGYETAGSNALIVQAGNLADYSDQATIATIPLTATGSFTAQDVSDSWTPTAVYRYWQLVQTTEDDIRVFEVELLDADETTGGVTDHEDLTGRDAADQHPADAVTVDDTAGWFTAAEVEAALAEGAAKMWGYQAHGNLGATETFVATTGWHSGTLNANCVFTLTGNASGTVSSMVLELAQDGTGGWTIDLPASVINAATLEADLVLTASTSSLLLLMSRDAGSNWYGFWAGGSGSTALTVEDEGTPLATAADTLDFVGAGVTASGTGTTKTITIPGATVTAADLIALGVVGPILIADDHSTPLVFADLLQTEDGDDLLYADLGA